MAPTQNSAEMTPPTLRAPTRAQLKRNKRNSARHLKEYQASRLATKIPVPLKQRLNSMLQFTKKPQPHVQKPVAADEERDEPTIEDWVLHWSNGLLEYANLTEDEVLILGNSAGAATNRVANLASSRRMRNRRLDRLLSPTVPPVPTRPSLGVRQIQGPLLLERPSCPRVRQPRLPLPPTNDHRARSISPYRLTTSIDSTSTVDNDFAEFLDEERARLRHLAERRYPSRLYAAALFEKMKKLASCELRLKKKEKTRNFREIHAPPRLVADGEFSNQENPFSDSHAMNGENDPTSQNRDLLPETHNNGLREDFVRVSASTRLVNNAEPFRITECEVSVEDMENEDAPNDKPVGILTSLLKMKCFGAANKLCVTRRTGL